MQRQTIIASYVQTICWENDTIVDWSSGRKYSLNGDIKQLGQYYGFGDSSISSSNGEYIFIYEKLGTKGLLLKNGELIREINRSYYCAKSYEYPAAFVTIKSKTYLIHCPIAYKQLDFEDVETGELITHVKGRKPDDMFHSRLEVSTDGTYLMSRGWVWHPLDTVVVFNIADCINNPKLLDEGWLYPKIEAEVCTASFIDNDTIIIGTSDEVISENGSSLDKSIFYWSLKDNKQSAPIKPDEEFGNLIAINASKAWDLYLFPKIIDLHTGEITECYKDFYSGQQRSAIINSKGSFPSVIFNDKTKQIAIMGNETIEIFTPSSPF